MSNENFEFLDRDVKIAFKVELHINKNNMAGFDYKKSLLSVCERVATKAVRDKEILKKLAEYPEHNIWQDNLYYTKPQSISNLLINKLTEMLYNRLYGDISKLYEERLAKAA